MHATFLFLFCVIIAYLVGSICSAVIVCRVFDLPDPRTGGSQNPGATNVLRLAGKQYALTVLLADMLKGLLPVLLAKVLEAGPVTIGFTCLAAVIGHIYPIFFGFKGGKGVATAMGALLGFHFILGVVVIATWLLVANFSRYASLASIVSMVLAPFYSFFSVGSIDAFLPIFFIALFILYQHRDNITRLMDGKETKINLQPRAQKETVAVAKTTKKLAVSKPKTTHKVSIEKKPAKTSKAMKVTKSTTTKSSTLKKTTEKKAVPSTKKVATKKEAAKKPVTKKPTTKKASPKKPNTKKSGTKKT